MRKVNTHTLNEQDFTSPRGKYVGFSKAVSEALGRDPSSTDLMQRHPFDVEIVRVPPGKAPYVYHSHSAQWEFYHVIAGSGQVRHDGGTTPIETGDAFLFKPGEAHQIFNSGDTDLVFYCIADNPLGESTHYPDSDKFSVRSPERRNLRSENLDYWDGEE